MNASEFLGLVLSIAGALLAIFLWGFSVFKRWRQLVRTYPDCPFVADHTFRELSGMVAGGSFRTAVSLALGVAGLRVSISWPFRLMFPAFVVQWAAVTSCRRERLLFYSEAIRIEVAGTAEPIHLRAFLWRDEDAVRTILDYWHDRHSNVA